MKTFFVLTALLFTLLLQAQPCEDTSFRKLYYAPLDTVKSVHQLTTSKGGTLIAGQYIPRAASSEGLVLHLDGNGDILWSKRFQSTASGMGLLLTKGIELSQGNFLQAGRLKNEDPREEQSNLVLLKTDPSGQLLWQYTYEAPVALQVNAVKEAPNGELLVMASSYADQYGIIFLVDVNGQLKWSRSIESINGLYISLIDCFVEGSDVIVWAYGNDGSCSTDDSRSINVYRLNLGTGEIEQSKQFCLASVDGPVGYLTQSNQYRAKKVGTQYYIYGSLGETQRDFALYRFDTTLNFVDGRAFFHPQNRRSFHLYCDDKGTISYMQQVGPINNRTLYLTTLNPDFTPKWQRAFQYPATSFEHFSLEGGERIATKKEALTTFALSYFNHSISTAVIEQLQLSQDLPSDETCMGSETLPLLHSMPMEYRLESTNAYNTQTGQITQKNLNLITLDARVQSKDVCNTISVCDTVKIKGRDTVCITSGAATFTAFKNEECTKRVSWEVDLKMVDSSFVFNDTMQLFFKTAPYPYEVWLRASVSTGCGAIKDSMKILVLPPPPFLTRDTTLCPRSTLRLNAGRWSKQYLWQDGSNDSIYTVSLPGTYYVQTESFCGTITSDTIQVRIDTIALQANASFACIGDTLTLRATPGLSTYSWLAGIDKITSTDSVIQVSSIAATTYKVSAKTIHGCTLTNELVINPVVPQRVNLGSDTAICEGASITLQAGAGFSAYAWNTGSESASIEVGKAGRYTLTVIDAEGCGSRDTLNLAIHPKPKAPLSTMDVLCKAQNDTLHAPAGLTYLWHDGSTIQSYPVRTPGTYWVQIKDGYGCMGRDTAIITAITEPPKDFMVSDTTLCAFQTLKLKPHHSYASYLWNSGSTQPTLSVQTAGTYSLKVWDQKGCMGEQTIHVVEKRCSNELWFPSAFSPNEDGKNDLFRPSVKGSLLNYNMAIFDRWGTKVFATTDISKGWNGIIKGRLQSTGVYVWSCSYQFQGEDKKIQKGTLTLVQ